MLLFYQIYIVWILFKNKLTMWGVLIRPLCLYFLKLFRITFYWRECFWQTWQRYSFHCPSQRNWQRWLKAHIQFNRPFPSCPSLCFKARLSASLRFLILMQKKNNNSLLHVASFWKWEVLELGNDLLHLVFPPLQCLFFFYQRRRLCLQLI